MKSDQSKTKAELIRELKSIRKRTNVKSSAERNQMEEALHSIAASFSAMRGEEFFNKVSNYLMEKLNIDYAFIGELADEDKVRIIGGTGKGKILEPFEYNLKDTPCENVMGQSLCCFTSGVQKLFPKDHLLIEMNIDGYLGSPLFDSSGKAIGIIVLLNETPIINEKIAEPMLQIFSERISAEIQWMQAEEKLRNNEERYRSILENIEEGYYEVDLTGCFTFFNDSLCRMLNYSRDELMGMNNRQYMDSESASRVYTVFSEVFKIGKPSKPIDIKIKRKDGVINFGEISISLLKDRNNKPVGFRGIVRDITERKKGETELIESEKRFSVLSESAFEGIGISDKGKVVDVNDRLAQILGYNRSELIGMDAMQFVAPESRELVRKKMISNVESPYEHKALKKDGTIIDVEVHGGMIPYAGKQMRVTTIRNITERKQADEALRNSEERYRLLFDHAPDAYFISDLKGKTIEGNVALENLLGLDKKEIIGKNFFKLDIIPKKYLPRALKLLSNTIKDKITDPEEFTFLRKDGSKVEAGIRMHFIKIRDKSRILGIARDITKRKKLEEKILSERNEFNSILHELPVGVTVLDADNKYVYINPMSMKIDGYKDDPKSLIGKDVKSIHPRHTLKTIEGLLKDFKSGQKSHFSREAKRGNRFVEISYHAIHDAKGEYQGLTRLISDITERKQAVEELKSNAAILEESQRVANLGSYFLDITTGKWIGSDIMNEIFGIDQSYEHDINGWIEIVHPEERKEMLDYFTNHVLAEGQPFDKEYRIIRKNDLIERWVHGLGKLDFDAAGKPIRMIGTIQDITVRKHAEEQLLKLSQSVEQSPASVMITDLDGNLEYVNPKFEKLTGYTSKEVLGKNPRLLNSGIQSKEFYTDLWQILTSGKEWQGEFCNRKKNGDLYWELASISPIADKNGSITHYVAVKEDITDRKKAREEIVRLKEFNESILDGMAEGVVVMNTKGIIEYVNAATRPILGYTEEELLDHHWSLLIPKDQHAIIHAVDKRRMQGERSTYDLLLKRRDGRFINVKVSGSPRFMDGEFIGTMAVFTDITEQKIASQKLHQQSLQRERLLETARRLTSILEIETVWKQISDEIRILLDCFGVTIYMLEDQGQILKPILAYDPPYEKQVLAANLNVNNCLTGQAVKAKAGMIFNYAEQKSGAYYIPGTPVDEQDHVLAMPIIIEGQVIGAITIYRREELFTEEDLALVETFVLYANTAINNAQLHQELLDQIEVRKNSEEQLKKTQEYTQNLIDTSMDMIISVDMKRKILEFNPAAEKAFGYKRDEILGKHVNILYANENAGRKLHKTIMDEGSHIKEILNKRKNGETFPAMLAASVLLDKNGEITGIVGVSRDITEQKAAERALRESEERYRSLINIAPLGISIHQEGKWVLVNQYTIEKMGYENEEELLGQPVLDMVHPDYREITAQRIEESVRTGKPLMPSEIKVLKKDGSVLDSITTGVLINFRGKPAIEVAAMDITELKKVIEEREHAIGEAEKANKVKSKFLANMSHEIRTPLNSILGFTDIIGNEIKKTLSSEMKEYFSIIQQSCDRLMNTVHGILDITRLETETVKLNPEPIDLNKIITDLISTLRGKVKEKQLDIRFDSHVRKSTIHSDLYCVTQALDNLIDNAIKYTEEGSITVHLKRKGKRLIAEVTDTGIGMSKSFMDRMFDPFTQESEGFSKKYQGIGLGLPLTKRYLDLIGAELKVESKKGKGSTFTIIFNNSSS